MGGMMLFHYLFRLLAAHAISDYVLQPEFMARWKHPKAQVPPGAGKWWWWMTAHALVNGGLVAWVTYDDMLGLFETVLHWGTDYAKCQGWISAERDQLIHLGSKVAWALLACW